MMGGTTRTFWHIFAKQSPSQFKLHWTIADSKQHPSEYKIRPASDHVWTAP